MNTRTSQQRLDDKQSRGDGEKGSLTCAAGIVHTLDLISRDLTVSLATRLEMFDIPPNCPVILHGESIKLRLVQPRDRVRIIFRKMFGRNIAERLEVQPDNQLRRRL